MGIGVSVFLMAAGAIMAFAVEVDSTGGFDLNAAGVILMVLGAIGLLVTLFLWGPRTRRTVVEGDAPARRTYYRETRETL